MDYVFVCVDDVFGCACLCLHVYEMIERDDVIEWMCKKWISDSICKEATAIMSWHSTHQPTPNLIRLAKYISVSWIIHAAWS